MPAGPSMVGAVAFIAVKFVGYRYAGIVLNRQYEKLKATSPSLFGFARTVLGIAAGVSFAFVVSHWDVSHEELLWYLLLFPVRMLEWLLVIWFFYERKCSQFEWSRALKLSFFGSLWSYVLDLPAALSVIIVPGGMWVC